MQHKLSRLALLAALTFLAGIVAVSSAAADEDPNDTVGSERAYKAGEITVRWQLAPAGLTDERRVEIASRVDQLNRLLSGEAEPKERAANGLRTTVLDDGKVHARAPIHHVDVTWWRSTGPVCTSAQATVPEAQTTQTSRPMEVK